MQKRQSQRLLAVTMVCVLAGATLTWEAFSTSGWAAGLVFLGVGLTAFVVAWYAWKSR